MLQKQKYGCSKSIPQRRFLTLQRFILHKMSFFFSNFRNSKLAQNFWALFGKTRTRLELILQYSKKLELEKSRLDHIPNLYSRKVLHNKSSVV